MKSDHHRTTSKKRAFVIGLSIILLVPAAFAAYFFFYRNQAEASSPSLQTARVRTGDLLVSTTALAVYFRNPRSISDFAPPAR